MPLPTKVSRGVLAKVIFVEATIDIASINAETVDASNDVSVPGAQVGDLVLMNWNNEAAKLSLQAYISAANVLTVVAINSTGSAVNAASATFSFVIIRRK